MIPCCSSRVAFRVLPHLLFDMKKLLWLTLPVIALVLLVGCDKPTKTSAPSSVAESASSTNVAATTKANPLFEKLLGRWERPDGGYVLEFSAVDAAGKMDAGYFNPGKINVERAQAVVESGTTKVFIVLRDVNYPGCTYKLSYDPKADQLSGEYFQASMQETYQVNFGRLK